MSLINNKKKLKKIIEFLPRFISKPILYKGYSHATKQLYLSQQELLKVQKDRIHNILKSAKQVPFYNDYKDKNRIEDFPIISKDQIKDKTHLIVNSKYKNTLDIQTSGSSGEPFRFKRLLSEERVEYSYVMRHFDRFGYKPGQKIAALRSYVPKKETDPTTSYSKLQNIYWFSAYHMDDKNIQLYIDILNKNKIKCMIAYPSSAYLLAEYCKKTQTKIPHLKAILVSSEKLLPTWKESIEKNIPGVELIDRYGTAEFSASLTYCSKCKGFHINEDYSYTELVHISEDRYYIVSTGFLNTAFPLIRYNTKDIFRLKSIKESECSYGSKVYVGEIEGRSSDLIFSNNKFLPGVNFYTAFYKYHEEIKQFQLIQEDKSSLEVILVLNDSIKDPSSLISKLEKDLKLRTGDLKLNFNIKEQISRDPKTNKIKNIVSYL